MLYGINKCWVNFLLTAAVKKWERAWHFTRCGRPPQTCSPTVWRWRLQCQKEMRGVHNNWVRFTGLDYLLFVHCYLCNQWLCNCYLYSVCAIICKNVICALFVQWFLKMVLMHCYLYTNSAIICALLCVHCNLHLILCNSTWYSNIIRINNLIITIINTFVCIVIVVHSSVENY